MPDRQDRQEQWAVFWCSLLSPLLYGEIPPEETGRFLHNWRIRSTSFPMERAANRRGPHSGESGSGIGKEGWKDCFANAARTVASRGRPHWR